MSKIKRRRFLETAAATVGAALVAGCSGGDGGDFEDGSDPDSGGNGGSDKDVELLSHKMVREDEGEVYESVAVEGEAENVSGGELSYAEVEVKFFADGTLQDSGLDNISGWSAGEVWAFNARYLGDNPGEITDYEIRASTSL